MRRPNLQGIRARVERLAVDVRLGACDQPHIFDKVSHWHLGDPAPQWPTAGHPERSVCDRELRYIHIVHECLS